MDRVLNRVVLAFVFVGLAFLAGRVYNYYNEIVPDTGFYGKTNGYLGMLGLEYGGYYRSGMKEGLWQWFDESGELTKFGGYVNGREHGVWEERNGTIVIAVQLYFHGKMIASKSFCSNNSTSELITYDEIGQVATKYSYRCFSWGHKENHDVSFSISQNDTDRLFLEYQRNGANREFSYYDFKLTAEYNRVDDVITGEYRSYHKENGALREIRFIDFFEDGKKSDSLIKKETVKEYYPSGILKGDYKTINGSVVGDALYYNHKGDLDRLVKWSQVPNKDKPGSTLSKKEIFSYYESGKLYSYEIYVDLKIEWLEKYSKDGEPIEKGNFISNRRHGDWVDYFYDEAFESYILAEGNYENGYKVGEWKETFEKDNSFQFVNYKKGFREGSFQFFDPNNNKSILGKYKRSLVKNDRSFFDGKIYFIENERLVSIINYVDGIVSGDFKYFHENGTLKSRGRFLRENYWGEYVEYYLNGNLAKKGLYYGDRDEKFVERNVEDVYFMTPINTSKQGEWYFYYNNGKPYQVGKFDDGYQVEKWTTYDFKGNIIDVHDYGIRY